MSQRATKILQNEPLSSQARTIESTLEQNSKLGGFYPKMFKTNNLEEPKRNKLNFAKTTKHKRLHGEPEIDAIEFIG